jgi:hypothetical protein
MMAAFIGSMNSLTQDFLARQKVGGISFSFYFLKQLAVPGPKSYVPDLLAAIASRVLEGVDENNIPSRQDKPRKGGNRQQ